MRLIITRWPAKPALAAASIILSLMLGACASTSKPPREVEDCRLALQEVAGRLEARKRLKGAYAKSLDVLPKEEAPVPPQVNGFPLEYRRTKSGFQLACKYELSGLNTCTMNHLGDFKCARAGDVTEIVEPDTGD
jgi:hypothetical protein